MSSPFQYVKIDLRLGTLFRRSILFLPLQWEFHRMMAGIERVIVTGAIGGILPEIEKVYSVLGAETVNELLDDASLAGKRLLVP